MASLKLIVSRSPADTKALGVVLGRSAPPGLSIALEGDLGAGKTCFVQGLARGLGIPEDVPITSPTFSLVNPYHEGRIPFYHLDLYRLGEPDELETLGFRDVMGEDVITAIEWADRFPGIMPGHHLRIQFRHRSIKTRELTFEIQGEGPLEGWLAAASL